MPNLILTSYSDVSYLSHSTSRRLTNGSANIGPTAFCKLRTQWVTSVPGKLPETPLSWIASYLSCTVLFLNQIVLSTAALWEDAAELKAEKRRKVSSGKEADWNHAGQWSEADRQVCNRWLPASVMFAVLFSNVDEYVSVLILCPFLLLLKLEGPNDSDFASDSSQN